MPSKAASTSSATGLNYWRKELLKVSLPALADTGARLIKMLKNPDISLRDLEQVISDDPVLSFQLIAKASQLRTNPENDVLSLPHALSLVGMDKLRPMLTKVKYIRFDASKTAHKAFLQALNLSLHAATQAYQIAERKNPGTGEGNYWISLRLSSVFWQLSLASPKTYHAIEQRVQTGESRTRVEQELMGCTTQQLTQTMLKDWYLSEYTQANLNQLLGAKPAMLGKIAKCAWRKEIAPEVPRSAGHFLQTPWTASVLAHWLALNTSVNWLSPKTDRVERMIATYLHQHLDNVVPFLHQNAVLCSSSHSIDGVWLPAIKLLHPPLPKRSVRKKIKADESKKAKRYKDLSSDTRVRAELKPVRVAAEPLKAVNPQKTVKRPVAEVKPAVKPVTQTSSKAKSPVADKNHAVQTALFKLYYLQTVKQQQVFSIHQMMDGASQVLHFDLGLTRCILFMKSRSHGSVKGVYAKGFADNSPFAKMTLNADSKHLFGKLLVKQAALWVKKENRARYVPELPEGLWEHLGTPDEFVLSSIMLRGKVSGILYADTKDSGRSLTDSEYSTFRALAQAISHGMGTLADQKEEEHRQQPPLI
ncbi:HDOD domain-containing protein [Oceanospirillum sanctuarii]|uniref:HDOD domain-containing protein n=1 Tax=Oceanospirillum sanctuarii TaxID=1434821 RepID=UPI000A393A23|nr:HDOD domain-containing protein [Oceanospirillum sanctuarii]